MIRVYILDDACEEGFRYTLYVDEATFSSNGFSERVSSGQHRHEVGASGHQDKAVGFDKCILN